MNASDTSVGEGSQLQETLQKPKLQLEVEVAKPSACERHISVTISADDVRRYFDNACTEMMPKASVPGFRSGRAPRKIVEQRFRKDLSEQVKGALLLDAMSQVTEDQDFSAISEPDFDYTAVEVPVEGPMKFEFDLEVRPEFDSPQWKGLQLERPVHEISSKDVDRELESILKAEAVLEECEGPVAVDDLIGVTIVFRHQGQEISRLDDEHIAVRPVLSFSDGSLAGFDKLMVGAKLGDQRVGKVAISHDAPTEALRGQDVEAEFHIHSIERAGTVKITDELLQALGMASEGELRDFVEQRLQGQVDYFRQQRIRQQITGQLTQGANWELPPALLRRQSRRELDRAVLELRRSGFTEDQVRAQRNELRQNSMATTERALKEHFILERIAEDEKLDVLPEDYDQEILLIARQAEMSPRATRAYIERNGMSDALRNQIIERKVLDMIAGEAKFRDVPFEPKRQQVEAVDYFVGGGSDDVIPEAKHAGEGEGLRQPTDYT